MEFLQLDFDYISSAGPKLTVEQFLGKLPSSVVKQGRIIDIRNSLGEVLQADGTGPSKVHLVETEAVKEMKMRLDIFYQPILSCERFFATI